MVFVYLLMALFGAAAVAFAVQNPEPIRLAFLGWKTPTMPLSFVLLMSAFVGVVVASVSAFAEKFQLQRRVRMLERQLAATAVANWPPAPLRDPVREPMRERLAPSPTPVPPAERACEPVAEATVARTTVTRTEVRPPI